MWIVFTIIPDYCHDMIMSFCDTTTTLFCMSCSVVSLCSNDSRTIDGNEFLDDQNYSDSNVWINELALLLYTIFYFTLTYIILQLIKKEK